MIEKNNMLFIAIIVMQLIVGISVLFFGSSRIHYLIHVRNENKNYQKHNKMLYEDINELRNKMESLNVVLLRKNLHEKNYIWRAIQILYTIYHKN